MNINITPFTIENRTNYLDTLLVSMFLSRSYIDTLLVNMPKSVKYMILQECIKFHFVDKIRKCKSVSNNNMNKIKYICLECGWKNAIDILEQHDIGEFYEFILSAFNGEFIKIKKINGDDSMDIPFIPISPPNIDSNVEFVKIVDLLKNWSHKDNNLYNIINTPTIIPIYINRFKTDSRNNIKIDIQKRIKIDVDNNSRWRFHSAICHVGTTNDKGRYYAIIRHFDKWYIYDNAKIPSIINIDIKDDDARNHIMEDVVFIIYIKADAP